MANLNFNRHVLTEREQRIADLRLAVTFLMEHIGGDEHRCNIIVGGGKAAWRIECTQNFRQLGLMINDDICDGVFEFFCFKVRERYWQRFGRFSDNAGDLAGRALDLTEEHTPMTPLEMVDDLTIDSSGTSDDGRRFHYGRDGAAEIEFEKLKDQMKEQIKQGGKNPFEKPAPDEAAE